MRVVLAATSGVLAMTGLAAPAQAQVPSVATVYQTVRHTVRDLAGDVGQPIELPSRMFVPYEITITRTPVGSSVVHDFPATEWNCTQPANAFANPFTVTCTAVVDQWECVAMPVTAESLAPNWTVTGTVGCTNSIAAGPTTWPAPAVSASTSLGFAPVVTCTADGGAVMSPLEPIFDLLRPFISRPVFTNVPGDLHVVKCGPDPYVP